MVISGLCLWPFTDALATESNTTLTFATDNSPPYAFEQDGQAEGIYVEIVKALLNNSGVRPEVIFCPWARCMQLVENGEVDMIAGVVKTPQRQQKFTFIEPAFYTSTSPFGFYYLQPQNNIVDADDLKRMTIGKLRGSVHYPAFDQADDINTVAAIDVPSLIALLQRGRIDAFIFHSQTAIPYLNGTGIKLADYQVNHVSQGFFAVTRHASLPVPVEELNLRMAELVQSGTIERLMSAAEQ